MFRILTSKIFYLKGWFLLTNVFIYKNLEILFLVTYLNNMIISQSSYYIILYWY